MRVSDFGNIKDNHDWELILSLWEDFSQEPPAINRTQALKRRAAVYLDVDVGKKLTRTEFRTLLAKANKMKTSSKKEERQRGIELAKQVQWAFNFHK
jgi:hypothetical protein